MGQAEWMLIVTIGSLVGVAAMGLNLVAAVWNGRAPRPVPFTTWLGVMVLAASVLWTRWDEDEPGTIVAAVATAEPVCSASSETLQAEPSAGGTRLDGIWAGPRGCHLWALIQDPRTGTVWLQGPADVEGSTWSLSLSLATWDTAEQLPYLVNIAAVGDETHNGWLDQSVAQEGIVSLDGPLSLPWLAREVPLEGIRR